MPSYKGIFDPVIERAANKHFTEQTGNCLEAACYACDCAHFRLVSVKNERHHRIVCSNCEAIQPELIGLYVGDVGGVA